MLAASDGVGAEKIRFYQRKGLLDTPMRDAGIRRYGSEDVRRLRFTRQLERLAHECGSGAKGPCPILSSFEG